MNYIPVKSKNTSLMLSTIVFTACLAMPLTASADTDASVDAIMEQLKSFKAPVPKVSTPSSIVIEDSVKSEALVEKPIETPKVETAPVTETKNNVIKEEPTTSGIYVAPEQQKAVVKQRAKRTTRAEKKVRVRSQRITAQKRSIKKAKKKTNKRVSKRINKRVTKIQTNAVDNEGFGPEYMALINDILNNKTSSRRAATLPSGSNLLLSGSNFSGLSGWIFVGKYSAGQSKGVRTLKSGNQLPIVGQQYTVKSPLLNMRKTRPLNSGLGKLIKVLRIGDQVKIKSLHRSSKNNYWANIVRP